MLDVFYDTDSRVREIAIWALGEIKDAAAVPGLMKALEDKDLTVYKAAYEALMKVRFAAIPNLLEALYSKNRAVRLAATKLLGETMDVAAVSGLVEALSDEYSDVRKNAAVALGKIGDSSAVPGLLQALHDKESTDVCCAAAEALGAMGDVNVVPELIQILRNDQTNYSKPSEKEFGHVLNEFETWGYKYFCKVTAEVLERIGTPEALAAVEEWRRSQSQ